MNFPTTFDDKTVALPYDQLGEIAQQAFDQLAEKGYEVRVGLTPELADQITILTQEISIKEYCPKDSSERFTDQAATVKWLSKGRAVFLLTKKNDAGQTLVVGYGWVGPGTSSHVKGGEITFAIRIAEAGQGQGLATPYSRLILAGASIMFGAKNVWLETWQSNAGAVHIYHKIGAEDVDQEPSQRPTANGKAVDDTRLYMKLADELLNV